MASLISTCMLMVTALIIIIIAIMAHDSNFVHGFVLTDKISNVFSPVTNLASSVAGNTFDVTKKLKDTIVNIFSNIHINITVPDFVKKFINKIF